MKEKIGSNGKSCARQEVEGEVIHGIVVTSNSTTSGSIFHTLEFSRMILGVSLISIDRIFYHQAQCTQVKNKEISTGNLYPYSLNVHNEVVNGKIQPHE